MSVLRSHLLLLLVSIIWGSAFVAQKIGLQSVGALTFNAVRFLIGGLCLVPFILDRFGKDTAAASDTREALRAGLILGGLVFLGSGCQQIGLYDTTGGKAAFITCLFIVFVPLLGMLSGQMPAVTTVLGSLVALVGLYLLCVKGAFVVARGDIFELGAAFFWSFQIFFVGRLAARVDPLKLAFFQFVTCAALSAISAIVFEHPSASGILNARIPLLYCGIFSIGLACTLQVVAQKYARTAPAAIILSLQTVVAVVGGALLLGERMAARELFGCALMFAGMFLAQVECKKGS